LRRKRGNIPGHLVTGISEGLLDLGLGGLRRVGDSALLELVGPILAAGVRHVGLVWFGGWGFWLIECKSEA
jgi:hypothetical protein